MAAKWNFEVEFVQACNCDYGCPCSFNALPTHRSCEALIGYHVRSGSFNGTRLDGATWAWGLWWPKAIHDGNGTSRVYFDPGVGPEQRKVLEEILAGKHGGGTFEIFPKTFASVHPPMVAKIDWKFNGHDSAFTVAGIGGVESTHIKNPVTGAEFEGQLLLPKGLSFKKAHVTSIEKVWLHDEGKLNFEHRNTAGFVTVTRFTEKGPEESNPP